METKNAYIRKTISKIREGIEVRAGCHLHGTTCGFGTAWYPKIFRGDSPEEIVIGLIADGEPQGFVFFRDGVVTLTEEGGDGDCFGGVKTTKEAFERILGSCFSAENIAAAKANV